MLLGSAYGKVSIDANGVQAGVNQAVSGMKTLESASAKIGGAMKSAGAALTVGVTLPIVAFGAASVKAAIDSESAMAELEAVIKSTGGAAGVTAKQVTDYATAMQKVTKFDDEAIIGGQSMLLTFTKIGKDVFPEASTAMLNMAEKFGSVDQAAMQLGKALNDPVAGVGALRRVGVALTDQQEAQIKGFMAVGDAASAQRIILKELEVEFGGLAEAAGATTEGQMIILKNQIGDLQETLGLRFIPTLISAVKFMTKMVDAFIALPAPVQNMIIAFAIMLAALGPVLAVVGQVITVLGALPAAWTGITAAVTTLGPILAGIGPAFAAIGAAITGTVIPAIVAFVVAAAPIILTVGLVIGAIALLYFAFKNNFGGITDTVKMLAVIIPFLFNQMWESVKRYFEDAWKKLTDYANKIKNSIVSAFQTDWGAIGRNIISGIVNGIISGIGALIEAAKRAATAVMDTFKRILKIGSPSKVFEYMGQMSGLGYANGLNNAIKPETMANVARRPVQQMANQQATAYQTINLAQGLSIHDARRMQAESEQRMKKWTMSVMGAR